MGHYVTRGTNFNKYNSILSILLEIFSDISVKESDSFWLFLYELSGVFDNII